MKYILCIISFFLVLSCDQPEEKATAQSVIDKAIEVACSGNCERALVDFTFRDRCYIRKRLGQKFSLERITVDSTGITHDILNNDGFSRYLNDTLQKLPDSMAIKYLNSVNSVHYFSQLPYGLNDPAVQKELLGKTTIKDVPYYKIRVTFQEAKGGKDFEDVFMYWIHCKTYTVDYLAYSFITDGGGIRFREAYNPRIISGIRFADYINYKPASALKQLDGVEELFEANQLVLLSKIETQAIGVQLLEDY